MIAVLSLSRRRAINDLNVIVHDSMLQIIYTTVFRVKWWNKRTLLLFIRLTRKTLLLFIRLTRKTLLLFIRLTRKTLLLFIRLTQKTLLLFIRLTRKTLRWFNRLTRKTLRLFNRLTWKTVVWLLPGYKFHICFTFRVQYKHKWIR